jgi:4-amino-4-deoxy-L-arabinose transferase-like glycosyltransferase
LRLGPVSSQFHFAMTEQASIPAATADSTPLAAPAAKKSRLHLWALLALTALSAFLCFNRLNTPSLLIDEVFTYWRTCGNLDQLLDTLQNDAFMPLHYELINWIHQGLPLGFGIHLVPGGIWLTPAALRFISALCGTLMTPIMYFLARQMFGRRTALFAAALITCSAYMLFFSRNAKMYAPAWTMETLNVACLFWWLRTELRLAWLCWIAAGIAAAGIHSITLLVLLPMALLCFLSMAKFGGWRVPMLVAGIALIAAGPAIYYGVFNRWTQKSGGVLPGVVGEPAPDAQWQNSGLNWIPPAGDTVALPFNALNNFLSGYDWNNIADLADVPELIKKYSGAMIALAATTYGLLILGALPRPNARGKEMCAQQWWRNLLWLLLWIVLPVYGFFYCRSVDGFSSPVDWVKMLIQYAAPFWPISIAMMVLLGLELNRWPRVAKVLAVLVLLLAVAAIVQTARNHLDWFDYLGVPFNRALAVAILPAMLFQFSGGTFRQRGMQLLRLVAVAGSVLLICEAAALVWRWLHDVSMRKHPELPWQSLWVVRYVALVMPAVWLAAAALISRLPTRVLQCAAVLMICSFNLANGLAREYVQTEVPLDHALADIYQSQPHSNVRTYFDLRTVFENIYYRPLAAYNACLAARLNPTPAEFRDGKTWPYQWGSFVAVFKNSCIYNPTISAEAIRAEMAAHPEVDRVIIWEIARPAIVGFSWGDPAIGGLGDGWVAVSDEHIISHWYWTWADQWNFHRREFQRKSAVY